MLQASEGIKWLSDRIRAFNLDSRHTNIRSIFELHSNWPGKLLFGRIPSFVVPYTVIWSCLRFQGPLSLSGRVPGFTMSYTTVWSILGFMVSCTAIWSISRLHNTLLSCFSVDFWASPLVFMIYNYLVESRLHGVLYLYLVVIQAS